jgi:hypothetical protein
MTTHNQHPPAIGTAPDGVRSLSPLALPARTQEAPGVTPELAGELFHRAGQTATVPTLVGHALAVAVMVGAYRERHTSAVDDEALRDLEDTLLVLARMLTDTGDPISLDELIAELGITQADIDAAGDWPVPDLPDTPEGPSS